MPGGTVVKIVGLVSHKPGSRRIRAPHGEYSMIETAVGSYLLRPLNGLGPDIELTAQEVSQYKNNRALKVIKGPWP
jgi:hypothetical protein